jgi:transcription elongation factor Elf1
MQGKCPFCNGAVEVKKTAKEGDQVYCLFCDNELEIVQMKPLELDWPLDDYDDWEDDEEWEDYDDEDD